MHSMHSASKTQLWSKLMHVCIGGKILWTESTMPQGKDSDNAVNASHCILSIGLLIVHDYHYHPFSL